MIKDILLGVCTINRPETTRKALEALMLTKDMERVQVVIVDNGSNQATKDVLYSFTRYPGFIDQIIYNEWNTGVAFGVNRWMSLWQKHQHCVQMDADCIMVSDDWVKVFLELIAMKDVAVVAAHRPTAWIDSGKQKLDFFKDMITVEERLGHWCEIPKNNLILTPFMMYKNTLVEHIGFQNEATSYDDIDYAVRVNCTGLKSLYATEVLIKQPRDEEQTHPQYGSHKALMAIRERVHNRFVDGYTKRAEVTLGTRFLPETMKNEYYTSLSDSNWEFLKEWKE